MKVSRVLLTGLLSGLLLAPGGARAQDRATVEQGCEREMAGLRGDRHEAACLERVGPIASREGDRLRLELLNGRTVDLVGNARACEERDPEGCLRYRLIDHVAPDAFLVRISHMDGTELLLIDRRTGRQTNLPARPHASPDGSRFASVATAEPGTFHGVEVWTLTPKGPKREWRFEPEGYRHYEFKGWDSQDRVKLDATLWIGDELREIDAEASRTVAGWQLRHFEETARPVRRTP